MKKRIARIFLVFFALINLLPLTALAAGSSAPPEEPYEKVAAKSGKWYAEQLAYDGKANLVIGYAGSWKNGGMPVMELKIREEIVLTGVYIPLAGIGEGDLSLVLTDDQGNVYKGFSLEKQQSGGGKESAELSPEKSAVVEADIYEYNTTCIFAPLSDMEIPKGNYTMTVEGTNELTGAFLVKGIHAGAYEKYKQALLDWELENNPEKGAEEAAEQTFGKEALSEEDGAEVEYGEQIAANPPVFALDGDYQVDEIIVSTYNDGQGASPGTISLIGENGQTYYSGQAYGANIENIPNAAWKIAPDVLLPAGNYLIALSQPEVVSYDQDGEPLFYVMASIPVQVREDFTGTYRINLDAYKTSTLAGAVSDQGSSFSLKDFELTVLDKEGEIELIGKYEGMPFSQRCEIVEETTEKIVAQFAFDADLTKLPYKAKISANAAVTIGRAEDGTVRIDMAGTGVYDRAASDGKGADHNTYDLTATGAMTQRELPPFVMTALGKAGSAGNVPGPDNAAQAAAGILFPPLVGLVVSSLQEALKPKAPARAPKKVRDKNWYKDKYPGKTDEQLAMIMLADAMGSTDNPDEGDAVSVGDNEHSESEAEASDGGIFEGDYEEEPESEDNPEKGYEGETEPAGDAQEDAATGTDEEIGRTEEQHLPEEEELPKEPETMVLKTSANGAESLYVKDPETGEWVNAETGGVLDVEKYPEAMEQMQSNKDWSAAREEEIKNSGGSEHDKALKQSMKEIQEKEQKANYENTLKKKYGTDDLGEINDIVKERKERAEEWAATWKRNDKVLGAMEYGAVAVGTAADVGIDGLSLVTPGGTQFKAGYKVLKGVAGTMAEAGAKGKDPFTLANLAEGAIKGGADAALDKIPGGNGFLGGVMSTTAKMATTTAGEAAGAGVGAALRGEDVGAAVEKGLKDGAYKATVAAVTDKLAGGLPNPIMSKGSFQAVPNLKNVIVSGAGGTKLASTVVDEYAVKPVVMGK